MSLFEVAGWVAVIVTACVLVAIAIYAGLGKGHP